MSSTSQQRLLDDRVEALGRLERRRLLLRLSTQNPHEDSCLDFSVPGRNGEELDPYVMMRHLHLPILEGRGFVHWDREKHEVTKGPRFGELESFLQVLREVREELPGRWV